MLNCAVYAALPIVHSPTIPPILVNLSIQIPVLTLFKLILNHHSVNVYVGHIDSLFLKLPAFSQMATWGPV